MPNFCYYFPQIDIVSRETKNNLCTSVLIISHLCVHFVKTKLLLQIKSNLFILCEIFNLNKRSNQFNTTDIFSKIKIQILL